jgi:hypothetical protein
MRIKHTLFTLALILSVSFVYGQYRTSIGGIGGKEGYGLSFKQFIQPEQFIEINLIGKQPGGAQVVGLFQIHKEIHASTLHTTSLSWSFGAGLHGGYWVDQAALGGFPGGNATVGIDGVFGFEYNFGFIPITIGAQARPFYEFVRTNKVIPQEYFDIAIMLRYIIID